MSASAKRFYSLLASLALLVGAVIIYSSYIVPLFSEVKNLRGEVAGEQGQAQQLSAISQNMSRLSVEYQNSAAMQSTISAILPTKEEIPTIINQLQGLAASNSVSISSISLQYLPVNFSSPGSIVQAVGNMAVSMQGSGSYKGINSFVDSLGNNIRLFDISSLSLSSATAAGTQKSATQALSFDMVINTYYEIQSSSTPASMTQS